MKAGRELDALIAEKVMGCQPFSGADGITKYCNCERKTPFDHGIHEMPTNGLKRYSTDIAAAWQVVEKIKEKNPIIIQFDMEYGLEQRSGWTVIINGFIEETFLEEVPLAICLAALKALDITVINREFLLKNDPRGKG